MVTFDTTARVRFNGRIGDSPLAALASLPNSPTGELTDIGAGIDLGLKQLERADARDAGAIVLVTDGKLETTPKSPYRKPSGAAWSALTARAAAVSSAHKVASFAIALGGDADAALLRKVFPSAEDIPADGLDDRLGQLSSALLRFQAAEVLRPELSRTVKAEWRGDLTSVPAGQRRTVELVLTSTFAKVPVEVSGLAIIAEPSLVATGLPTTVRLAPGDSHTFPVEVTATIPGSRALSLTGNIESPWSSVITDTLRLRFAPHLEGETELTVIEAPAATPVPVALPAWASLVGIGMGLTTLLGALAVLGWRFSRATLAGALTVHQGSELVDSFLLSGRQQRLGVPGAAAVRLSAAKARDRGPGVVVAGRPSDGKPVTATLYDGESLTIGNQTFTYVSPHSRMMSLINVGR